jgi:hypothetical protein
MQVGDIVKLTVPLLNNPMGTIGICYERYVIGDRMGSSFIFENGHYDGFSPEEQKQMLEYLGHENGIAWYNFVNVMRLSLDFNSGVFEPHFDFWKSYLEAKESK